MPVDWEGVRCILSSCADRPIHRTLHITCAPGLNRYSSLHTSVWAAVATGKMQEALLQGCRRSARLLKRASDATVGLPQTATRWVGTCPLLPLLHSRPAGPAVMPFCAAVKGNLLLLPEEISHAPCCIRIATAGPSTTTQAKQQQLTQQQRAQNAAGAVRWLQPKMHHPNTRRRGSSRQNQPQAQAQSSCRH